MKSIKYLSVVVSGLVGLSLTAANAQALLEKTRGEVKGRERVQEKEVRRLDEKLSDKAGREAAEGVVHSAITTNVGVSEGVAREASGKGLDLLQHQISGSCSMSLGQNASFAVDAAEGKLVETSITSVVEAAKSAGFQTMLDGPVFDASNQQITLLNTGEVGSFVLKNTLTDSTLRQGAMLLADATVKSIKSGQYATIKGEFGTYEVPAGVLNLFVERIGNGDVEAGKEALGTFCGNGCPSSTIGANICRKAA